MIIRHLLVALALGLLFGSCANTSSTAPATAGEQPQTIRKGMTREQVDEILGSPDVTNETNGIEVARYSTSNKWSNFGKQAMGAAIPGGVLFTMRNARHEVTTTIVTYRNGRVTSYKTNHSSSKVLKYN